MRTISMINLKGGVGKTTTAITMAAILAMQGKQVLLMDADPQANATAFFGVKDPEITCGATMAQLLDPEAEGRSDQIEDYIIETPIPGVQLIPSSIELIRADIASVYTGRGARAISDAVQALRFEAVDAGEPAPYDFIIIDCPPSFTAASVAAIYASDDVIVPVEPDAFAIAGLATLLRQIESVRRIQPRVRVAGALITQWHRTPAVIQGEAALRGSAVPVFDTVIRRSDKVTESIFLSRSLIDYSSRSAAAKDYVQFVAEYLEGVQ